jgi:hypothetical protein
VYLNFLSREELLISHEKSLALETLFLEDISDIFSFELFFVSIFWATVMTFCFGIFMRMSHFLTEKSST